MLWRYLVCNVKTKGSSSSPCDSNPSGHPIIGIDIKLNFGTSILLDLELKKNPRKNIIKHKVMFFCKQAYSFLKVDK
jgi:hypothetical protein